MRSVMRKWWADGAVQPAEATYIALVGAARHPFFYDALGVPDTLDGRFEMIVLHLFLLQERLRTDAPGAARTLSEIFFRDMDRSLRELGISDTGVPRRVKAMAKAYHGRLQAYATQDAETLRAALARNLYGTVAEGDVAHLDGMARYMAAARSSLAGAAPDAIADGSYAWPVPA